MAALSREDLTAKQGGVRTGSTTGAGKASVPESEDSCIPKGHPHVESEWAIKTYAELC